MTFIIALTISFFILWALQDWVEKNGLLGLAELFWGLKAIIFLLVPVWLMIGFKVKIASNAGAILISGEVIWLIIWVIYGVLRFWRG